MQGASFTISSLGGIGGTAFTPIVNAPEVAILGVVRSRMAPIWDGQAFQPRLMLPLSVSYDHRVIDGALAARFTRHLCACPGGRPPPGPVTHGERIGPRRETRDGNPSNSGCPTSATSGASR